MPVAAGAVALLAAGRLLPALVRPLRRAPGFHARRATPDFARTAPPGFHARRATPNFARAAPPDARLLRTRPARVLALWGGAAAFPLPQGGVVARAGRALGIPLSWGRAALAFLLAGAAAGAVPAPDGTGPVDAAPPHTAAGPGRLSPRRASAAARCC
ncbi:hypothetical protein ACIF8T_14840 [Streptomyces sp. NPDC085946]|uniref:hypothetical protein n=1 Tax=Streptomyces sp. NPDC085946 TaxID=3365744 RepID=UPI0037CF23CA